MKIFHYKENTGEFIGESIADADPLQTGQWLIPAHATNVEPPDHVEGSTRHFIAYGWEYKEIPIEPEPVAEEPITVEPVPMTAEPIQVEQQVSI